MAGPAVVARRRGRDMQNECMLIRKRPATLPLSRLPWPGASARAARSPGTRPPRTGPSRALAGMRDVVELDRTDHGQVARATDDEVEVLRGDAIERPLTGGLSEPRPDYRNVRNADLAEDSMVRTDGLIQRAKKRALRCHPSSPGISRDLPATSAGPHAESTLGTMPFTPWELSTSPSRTPAGSSGVVRSPRC